MTNGTKKNLDSPQSDADIVIWPRLKAKALKLGYGSFRVTFQVHGGQLRQADICDVVERIASF